MKRFLVVILLCQISVRAENMNVYGVILAGGVGERLWPLSRQHHPKQFLSIHTSHNLLEQSVERLQRVIPNNNIWIITSEEHERCIDMHIKGIVGHIVCEPCSKNTAPALLYACLELYQKDPESIAVFVPADPYIPEKDYASYQQAVTQAISYVAQNDAIVLCGVKPTYPATGYGYIEYEQTVGEHDCFPVTRFHEKPSLPLARSYIQQSNMLWNIGMFVGKVSTFIDEYKRVAPDFFAECMQFHHGDKAYKDLPSISVDCAVIERSNRTWVLPVDFSWCDVGNVNVFLSMKEQVGSNTSDDVIAVDAHNNLVDVPNKLVALVGVDDLCIVETSDALLITKRADAEKVRSVVTQLKQKGRSEYL